MWRLTGENKTCIFSELFIRFRAPRSGHQCGITIRDNLQLECEFNGFVSTPPLLLIIQIQLCINPEEITQLYLLQGIPLALDELFSHLANCEYYIRNRLGAH